MYVLIGIGMYRLFPDLQSDIVHVLPQSGMLPVITRLAMIGTVTVSAPLFIIPCAELLLGGGGRFSLTRRVLVRIVLVCFCVIMAVSLPSFVKVLALVGCFCVATFSCCVPPILHLRLCLMHARFTYVFLDSILILCGVSATVVTTYLTLQS